MLIKLGSEHHNDLGAKGNIYEIFLLWEFLTSPLVVPNSFIMECSRKSGQRRATQPLSRFMFGSFARPASYPPCKSTKRTVSASPHHHTLAVPQTIQPDLHVNVQLQRRLGFSMVVGVASAMYSLSTSCAVHEVRRSIIRFNLSLGGAREIAWCFKRVSPLTSFSYR